ncbi:MAG: sugar phosphate isomerase/epimerase [Deltaproteobacteria bacterium]|nr:sugar phosphate isomerase/epimerase [Deltaproteobacteria bacterium]
MFEDIIKHVQVCIPFRLLKEKYLSLVLKNRINPEIGIDGEVIDTVPEKDFSQIASILHREGLIISMHGPFYDLVPGGLDKKMLKATRERLRQAFELVPVFDPVSIVCHTGYDRKRYYRAEEEWLEAAIETWAPLVEDLQGTRATLMLENVYEKTPRMFLKLLNALNSEKAAFCFDPGHMNLFSEADMEDWLKRLGPFLGELHLHDNKGRHDEHLAIGAGMIDFETIFKYIEENQLRPVITLEAHKEEWVWQSIEALSRSERFCRIIGL